jgi:thiol-disulfide isomerase/thioredoxin
LQKTVFFSGFISEPTLATITYKNKGYKVEKHFFIEPGRQRLVASKQFVSCTLIGSITNNEQEQLDSSNADLERKIQQLQGNDKLTNLDSVQLDMLSDSLLNKNKDFIRGHPNSYLSAYLMLVYFPFFDFDEYVRIYHNLNPSIKRSSYGREIQGMSTHFQKVYIGQSAPDFEISKTKVSTIKLSDQFRKGYVLLDFWASWCIPCRQEMPKLKKLQEQYKTYLEVITISLDEDVLEWKSSISQDSIGMLLNLLAKENKVDIPQKYAVSILPEKILINREGVIIGRYKNTLRDKQLLLADLKRLFNQ